MKRIFLFLAVNFLVIITISIVLSVLGVQPYLTSHGLNVQALMIFCLIWGMGGAFISLLLSKKIAKWSMNVQIIDPDTQDPQLRDILNMVYSCARKGNLGTMPEVGIYESPEVNAFATGPSRSNSLVALSSGLLRKMDRDSVEGVIAHEVAHIANGDMVTMTLLQGIINAFVMFLARIIAYVIMRGGDDRDSRGVGNYFMYHLVVIGLQMVFMVLGSMVVARFSRWREFRADAGGAEFSSKRKMVAALQSLKQMSDIQDESQQDSPIQAFKISNTRSGWLQLLATHPPLDARIENLERS